MDAPTTTWIDTPPAYQGLRAVVMGLGRFGGGEASVRFLAERGARVTATDLKPEQRLADVIARLKDLRDVDFRLGQHIESDFLSADLIVVNPVVPLNDRLLQRAADAGVRLTSEVNLFWLHCPAPIIGVTGTNGKSTTASLIHDLLRASGLNSRLGGNIGHSLLGELNEITARERVVLELSSFQLQSLSQIRRSPAVAVVTNFAPNHLERHGTLEEYRRAKQTVLRFQHAEDIAILNADDDDPARWPTCGRRLFFGRMGQPEALFDADGVSFRLPGHERRVVPENPALQGTHNMANLAAATLAAYASGAALESADAAVGGFRGLPHRLQRVAEQNGRVFINDSNATTPESASAAIDALQRKSDRIILLAGGADKQVDLKPLAERIAESVCAVALMGETAKRLATFLDEICGHHGPQRFRAPSFEAAFEWAVKQSRSGDTVLLSPGCASYGWFENFEERGSRFDELVQNWARHS